MIFIHEPIKELRDEIWDTIYVMEEKELQSMVNSENIIRVRKSLEGEIRGLGETLERIKETLIEGQGGYGLGEESDFYL